MVNIELTVLVTITLHRAARVGDILAVRIDPWPLRVSDVATVLDNIEHALRVIGNGIRARPTLISTLAIFTRFTSDSLIAAVGEENVRVTRGPGRRNLDDIIFNSPERDDQSHTGYGLVARVFDQDSGRIFGILPNVIGTALDNILERNAGCCWSNAVHGGRTGHAKAAGGCVGCIVARTSQLRNRYRRVDVARQPGDALSCFFMG